DSGFWLCGSTVESRSSSWRKNTDALLVQSEQVAVSSEQGKQATCSLLAATCSLVFAQSTNKPLQSQRAGVDQTPRLGHTILDSHRRLLARPLAHGDRAARRLLLAHHQ